MKIKAVLFGATGMVGEGVLHECLKHPDVVSVVVVNRQPCSVKHEKLNEIIHSNFHDFSEIEDRLSGYNAGFFCMGVSSIRMKEDDYRRITYDLTIHVAETLLKHNPHMTFCYVSGAGTDSSENGKVMWARVKGKTENDLLKMAFKSAYMFRPGYIQPTKGLKNAYKIYRYLSPFYPVWKTLFPSYVCTLKEIGLAMISVVKQDTEQKILENKEIRQIAARS